MDSARNTLLSIREAGWSMDRASTYNVGGEVSVEPRYERVPNEAISEAIALRARGEYEQAVEVIAAAASAPVIRSDPSALVALALAHSGLGGQEDALEYLEWAERRLNEQLGMVWGNRATFLGLQGRYDEAKAAATMAVDLLPERWDISADLMVAHEMCGDGEAAEAELRRIRGVLLAMPPETRREAAGYIKAHAGLADLLRRVDLDKELGLADT
ncbi:MAG: tetratricopeptide repeat protein [Gammaproteobacteria bacterium]|nr:tetratricopeptide repeat protein [Gammaproteobacteria bacterium]